MNLNRKSKIALTAPAKINLRLKVVGRRPDGYHDLQMVMVKLSLADEIDVERVSQGVSIQTDFPELPTDRTNTIWKAVEALQEVSVDPLTLKIVVRKKIPVAAGLGGGSSDAASLLQGLVRHWNLDLSNERLFRIAVKIGADVPFFLAEGPQIAEGIGDKLQPITQGGIPPLFLILLNPGFPLSTPMVYQWYDEDFTLTPYSSGASIPRFFKDLRDLTPWIENDLEEVVFRRRPAVRLLKEELMRAGAPVAMMSGSGPTVFGIFEGREERDKTFVNLQRLQEQGVWICKTETVG